MAKKTTESRKNFKNSKKIEKIQNFPKNTPGEHCIEAVYQVLPSCDDWKLVKSLPNRSVGRRRRRRKKKEEEEEEDGEILSSIWQF